MSDTFDTIKVEPDSTCLTRAGSAFFQYNGPRFRDDMTAALDAIDSRLAYMTVEEVREAIDEWDFITNGPNRR